MLDSTSSCAPVPAVTCMVLDPWTKRAKVAVPVAAIVSVAIAFAVIVPDAGAPNPARVCVTSAVLPDKAALALAGGVPLYMVKVAVP